MPSLADVALCGVAELLIGFAVGLPVARFGFGSRVAPALAPISGWAVFNVLALPILSIIGFSRLAAALLCGIALLGGLAALVNGGFPSNKNNAVSVPPYALVAAALLAVIPALALWPKAGIGGGVLLSAAMFDHSKAAIIDDIARLGLPPGNPFCALGGPHLVYYYLWHFGAAIPAALFGTGGWAADIALTWFTAFASLALMMGLTVHLGGGRLAAWLVIPISLAGSLIPVARWLLPGQILDRALSTQPWPQAWLFQASWVPQHLAAAGCVVLAALILPHLAARGSWQLVPLLGAVAAAGFQSSVWVGGIIFAAAAVPIGLVLLLQGLSHRDWRGLLLKLVVAGMAAAILSGPFLRDELAATASRQAGSPIAWLPFPVLGELVPKGLRSWLDLPAFWLVLMPIEFSAIVFAGIAGIARIWRRPGALATDRLAVVLTVLAAASFIVPSMFASTIANNDLGWRGVLPGILVLTALAAAAGARWLRSTLWRRALAIAIWGLALPGGVAVIVADATGTPAASAPNLAKTPELWAAVRRHAAPGERVSNNPLFLADSVRWPVNISWALLSDRRSCYAGWNLARAFVPLPAAEIDQIDALFVRVFAGEAEPGDIARLAERFDCKVVVVTPEDGAWRNDPFAASVYYRRVEEKTDRWRIYRLADRASDRSRTSSADAATRIKVAMMRDAAASDPLSEPATLDRPALRRR